MYFAEAFKPGTKILDIGCGSGRDIRILHEMGFLADGVDACEEFVDMINSQFTINDLRFTVFQDSLPELTKIADKF